MSSPPISSGPPNAGNPGSKPAGPNMPTPSAVDPLTSGQWRPPTIETEPLLVEVQGENGAYYHAFVRDVFKTEILLAFERAWQSETRFPFDRVRLPPPATPP